jgi:WD40 repeat protein
VIDPTTFLKQSALYSQSHLLETTVVKRDPVHSNIIGIGCDRSFLQIDLRTPQKLYDTLSNNEAHSDLILDLDYNPNKVNTLATCGQDSVVRFWDLRRADKCIL